MKKIIVVVVVVVVVECCCILINIIVGTGRERHPVLSRQNITFHQKIAFCLSKPMSCHGGPFVVGVLSQQNGQFWIADFAFFWNLSSC